jgi:outer membrane protein assembly factor BamB
MQREDELGNRKAVRSAALAGAAVAGVFCLVVSLLLLANYLQLRLNDPLNSPALVALRTQFAQQQSNETLKAQIRTLDLMARKAFFTTTQQLRVGGFLLLGGAVVCVGLTMVAGLLRPIQPDPKQLPPLDAVWLRRAGFRRGVGLAGGVLLAAALAAWIGADRNLGRYEVAPAGVAKVPVAEKPAAGSGAVLPARGVPSREVLLKNWPNFRGPDGNGVSFAERCPTNWNGKTGEGIKWKLPIPRAGFSSPIIWGKRIFLTAGDKDAREIYGVDADSGALLWTTVVKDVPGATDEVPDVAENTGLAASTPATDGERVYAIFGTGELFCTDLDGRPVWSRFLGKADNHYGHSSSLLVVDGLLIVQLDQVSRARVLALDTRSGKTVWEKDRPAVSWASPICVGTGRRKELILCDSTGVESYDPTNGVTWWREDCLGGEAAPSAAYAGGMVFVASDYARASGLRLTDAGVEVAWQWEETLPDTASLLATPEHVFMATRGRELVCLGAKDGKLLWQQEYTSQCYASPILAGGRVYALDMDGVTHIVEAAGEYRAVATCPLGENAGATPAFADGRIYIRGFKNLYGIGE